jgi:hypothetical protein
MADNRYWGRGDKTKHPLPDAEVERLIALRSRWAVSTERALTEWIEQDPISIDQRENAHIFVIADPVPPRDRMLLDTFATGDYTVVLRDLVLRTKIPAANSFAPDVQSLSNFSTTADGWAWKTWAVFGQRDEGDKIGIEREAGALIVEIYENGRLRLMCGRATENYQDKKLMFDNLVLGLTARVVSLASVVSTTVGFFGSWDFAVGITGLRGAISNQRYSKGLYGGPTFTRDTYTAATRASAAALEVDTGPTVELLLGRLFRAVGAAQIQEIMQFFVSEGG